MSEKPPLLMHRRGATLIAHAPMDREALMSYDAGKPLRVQITQPRHVGRLRLYWSLVDLIRENLDNPPSREDFHDAIKVRLGYRTTVHFKDGKDIVLPRSIAFDKMDEPEFQAFLNAFFAFVREKVMPGIGKSEFMAAAEEMMGPDPSLTPGTREKAHA